MEPPSAAAGSDTGADSQVQADMRLRPPTSPAPDNRFSVSPRVFVRSSDVVSRACPKPPTRRRTRHKVFDTRLSSGDAPDGVIPPPDEKSQEQQQQQQQQSNAPSTTPDTSEYGGGAKPNGEQAKEEMADANALRNGAVTIVVQEPVVDAPDVHATANAEPERDKQDARVPVVDVSARDGSIDLPVPTDLQPSEAAAAEKEKSEVAVSEHVTKEPADILREATPPPRPDTPAGYVEGDEEGEVERPPSYLTSSDSDSDVELITAGYDVVAYEEPSPPPPAGEGEEQQPGEEDPHSEQAESLAEEQPGEEVTKDGQPGDEVTKDGQPGEEVAKDGQPPGEATPPQSQPPGEEATQPKIQPGEEAIKTVQPGEEAPKGHLPVEGKLGQTGSTLDVGVSPATTCPSPTPKKRPLPPPKPPKPPTMQNEIPAVVQDAQPNSPLMSGAQSNSPLTPQLGAQTSPLLSTRPLESNRSSLKKKVPPPIVPTPYAAKAMPPVPPKKSRPAPPPRSYNTHLSTAHDQSSSSPSLTTMPGREPSPVSPIAITSKQVSTDDNTSEMEGHTLGTSPLDDRLRQRPRVPSPPREEGGAQGDEAPVHLMSKPEYVHHGMDNRSSTASSVMQSPISASPPPSTLTRVGRRLSIGLIKELATQEALASYDIISDSSEAGDGSQAAGGSDSVEDEDIYAIVKACNTATPKKVQVSDLPPKIEGFPTDKRSLVIHELYTTEHTYVSRLEVLIEVFKEPLSKLLGDEAGSIFGNVDDICAFNKRFLALLYERISDWDEGKGIGDLFLGMFTQAHKSMYSIYCSNYDQAEVLLYQKMKRKDFELQLQQCLTHPRIVSGLSLPAYIILPVQRIPRYILLLKDIIKYTPEDHKGYKQLVTSMEKMKELANYIDTQVKESQTKKSLESLKNKVQGLADLDSTERVLVKDGQVFLKDIKRLYQCILFSDLLVFAAGDNRQSAVELALRLEAVWVEDLGDRDPQTSMEDAIEIYNPERPYTIYTCNKAEKKLWLAKLKETIYADLLKSSKCLKRDDMSSECRIARFVYNDGRVYSGDYQDAQCHGKGIMNWPNKSVYSGDWKDNERDGEGEFTFNTGDVYQGGWVEDKQTGFGELRYASNDVYRGWWRDGLQHGNGKVIYANGDTFDGHFEHGQIEGKGHLKCTNGLEYDGDWKFSQREGQGVLKTVSGNVYTGAFKHDRMHGKGAMAFTNGDHYEGSWKNGVRHGTGTLKTAQNGVYEGSWDRDMKHGAGKELYPNGDMYEGTWELNRRKGKGVLRYKTGEVYTGEFHNDLFHGEGEMKYFGISKYQGSWTNGLRHGNGVMVYSDGSSYTGSWEAGLRSGVGELVCCDGVNYKGQWSMDKPHGRGLLRNPIASYFYDGDWENGMREGKGTEQSQYGKYVGHWKNDLKSGRGQERAVIGTVFDGTWDRGRKSGRGTRKMVFGAIEEQVWKNGLLQNNHSRMTAAELPYVPRYDY